MSSSSIIALSAQVGDDVSVGHFSVVGEDVHLGDGCRIGSHVIIHDGARIGARVRIDDHAVIGKQPMRAVRSIATEPQRQPPAVVEDRCLIGTGAVVYAGSTVKEAVMVADYATIREGVTVGAFTIVGRAVAVEPHASIGARCKLETNAYITAYSTIEDDVFVAPGVLTSNDRFLGRTEERLSQFKGPTVRRGGRLGVGSVLLPAVEVGEDALVAAGAVLTKRAEPGVIYMGVPARAVRSVPEEQKLKNQEDR